MKKLARGLICFLLYAGTSGFIKATTYYVDSVGGNDGNSGQSSAAAWKTIAKVNSVVLSPGDSVLFKRGGIWRESLTNPSAGTAGKAITYADYGTGAKPSIRGSDAFNNSSNWTNKSGNLWYAVRLLDDPLVFAHDGALGARKANKGDLAAQWDYWYDAANDRLYVFSTANPASLASLLEMAVRYSFVQNQTWSFITYQNLDLRHYRGGAAWLGVGSQGVTFQGVDVLQVANFGLQFKGGASGTVSSCTLTDWGVLDAVEYGIVVDGTSTLTTGPVDVTDSKLTINHVSFRILRRHCFPARRLIPGLISAVSHRASAILRGRRRGSPSDLHQLRRRGRRGARCRPRSGGSGRRDPPRCPSTSTSSPRP